MCSNLTDYLILNILASGVECNWSFLHTPMPYGHGSIPSSTNSLRKVQIRINKWQKNKNKKHDAFLSCGSSRNNAFDNLLFIVNFKHAVNENEKNYSYTLLPKRTLASTCTIWLLRLTLNFLMGKGWREPVRLEVLSAPMGMWGRFWSLT